MSSPASVTKCDFREAIKFWPFPPQNDLKWKASQFFLQQVKLLLCRNVGFLAFIPSAGGEIRRVDCIMHLSRVMRAGSLCVNKTQLKARQEGEKDWRWWENIKWASSLPHVANDRRRDFVQGKHDWIKDWINLYNLEIERMLASMCFIPTYFQFFHVLQGNCVILEILDTIWT